LDINLYRAALVHVQIPMKVYFPSACNEYSVDGTCLLYVCVHLLNNGFLSL